MAAADRRNAARCVRRAGWGDNRQGQLGLGRAAPPIVRVPAKLRGVPALAAISAGAGHALAVSTAGEAFAWGANGSGQAGVPAAGAFC